MSPPSRKPRVAVVGAGVLGLMCARRLAQEGARVTVYEAQPHRPNASRVAAGMIAPAAECALEPPLREVASFLRDARLAWDSPALALLAPITRLGTVIEGTAADVALTRQAVEAVGFHLERPPALLRNASHAAVFAPQDAAISTGAALDALRADLLRLAGEMHEGRVERAGEAFTLDGAPLEVDAVVLAPGAPGQAPDRARGLAPELVHLLPIKGQLLRWTGVDIAPRPMLRFAGEGYLAFVPGEVTVGATLEPGRDDLDPEPALLDRHRAEAEARVPELRGREPTLAVGVRADTPDGLPMVGPSALPGVFLATGARRNGWLWAPPIASIVMAQVLGRPLGELAPLAERLHPGRFDAREAP